MNSVKKNVTLAVCVLIMVGGMFIPEIFGMPQMAVRTLFFTVAILLLLITESMHIGTVALFMMALQPILGLTQSFTETVTNFNTPIFFFMLSAFIIAGAVQESQLSKRMLKFLLIKFGNTTKGAIFAILTATALLSTVIANLPALALFFGSSLNLLDMFEDKEDRKQTGKSLCIGLIYASLCGGVCTVVGNMNPIIASEVLQKNGYHVSFLQWMLIGVPVGIILFPLMVFLLFRIFPPVEISDEKREKFIDGIEVKKKMSAQEIWVLTVIILMAICWIFGSHIPLLNTMHVALCGAVLMLLPSAKVMEWKTAGKHIEWASVLLTCAFISLAEVFTSSGLTDWILGLLNHIIPEGANAFLISLILGIVTVITLLLISNGPALITIFAIPIIGIATKRGIHPSYLMVPMSMFMTFTVLIPIDSISLITYASGTYEMKDELKTGLPFAVIGIIVISAVTGLILKIMGF